MLMYANMVLEKAGKWVGSLQSKHTRLDICPFPTNSLHKSPQKLWVCLYDIPRQPTCMKLGTRELYQPVQWLAGFIHVFCLARNILQYIPRQDSIPSATYTHNAVG